MTKDQSRTSVDIFISVILMMIGGVLISTPFVEKLYKVPFFMGIIFACVLMFAFLAETVILNHVKDWNMYGINLGVSIGLLLTKYTHWFMFVPFLLGSILCYGSISSLRNDVKDENNNECDVPPKDIGNNRIIISRTTYQNLIILEISETEDYVIGLIKSAVDEVPNTFESLRGWIEAQRQAMIECQEIELENEDKKFLIEMDDSLFMKHKETN